MSYTGKLILTLAALILLTAVAPHAKAEPLFFSDVRAIQLLPSNPTVNVTTDLFANPGVTLMHGSRVTFAINITGTLPPGTTNLLRLTFVQPSSVTIVQDFSIPAFGSLYPPFTLLVSRDFPVGYQPVPISMTVDIIGSSPDFVIPTGPNAGQRVNSYTYNFNVVQPVPEPSTLLLLGTGTAALVSGIRKRRKAVGNEDTTRGM